MLAIDISWLRLAIFYGLLGVPIALLLLIEMRQLVRDVLVSVVRMSVQLLLVGIYVKFLFELNSLALNVLWIAIMAIVACVTVVKRTGLAIRVFFWPTLLSMAVSSLSVLAVMLLALVKAAPWYDARYFIPIAGMLFGNCLQGNILSLDSFYSKLDANQNEYVSSLFLGASPSEAVLPFLRASIKVALMPTIASMMTIGLVALPGMVTGQMLGGAPPLLAIKYQIAIMLGIFSCLTVSSLGVIRLSLAVAINRYGILRDDIYANGKHY